MDVFLFMRRRKCLKNSQTLAFNCSIFLKSCGMTGVFAIVFFGGGAFIPASLSAIAYLI